MKVPPLTAIRTRSLWGLGLAAVMLTAVLSACGAAPTAAGTHGASRHTTSGHHASHTSAPSTPGKSASGGSQGTTEAAGTPARCRTANLSVSLAASQGAAGSVIRVYEFTNQGSAACTLYGYPGLELLTASRQPLPTTVVRRPATGGQLTVADGQTITTSKTEATVTLPVGGHAWTVVQYAAGTGYSGETCPTSAALEITAPNAYHSTVLTGLAGQIQAFGGTTTALHCGILDVEPVTGNVTAKTPSATLTRCTTAHLTVTMAASGAAAGSIVRVYEFTNEGPGQCTLYGYPGYQLLGASGAPLPTTVVRRPPSGGEITLSSGALLVMSSTEQTVTLPVGGHAWSVMQFADAAGYANETCPTSAALLVTAPNAYHSTTLSGTAGKIQAFGGSTAALHCGILYVQPVTANLDPAG